MGALEENLVLGEGTLKQYGIDDLQYQEVFSTAALMLSSWEEQVTIEGSFDKKREPLMRIDVPRTTTLRKVKKYSFRGACAWCCCLVGGRTPFSGKNKVVSSRSSEVSAC